MLKIIKSYRKVHPKVLIRLGIVSLCPVALLLLLVWLGSLDQRRIESWRITQSVDFAKTNSYRHEFQPTESGINNARVIVPRIPSVVWLHVNAPLGEIDWSKITDNYQSTEKRNEQIRELLKRKKQAFIESLSPTSSLLSWRILENDREVDHGVLDPNCMSAWTKRGDHMYYRFENDVTELDPKKQYTLLLDVEKPSKSLSTLDTVFTLGPAHRHGKDTVWFFNYVFRASLPIMLFSCILIAVGWLMSKTKSQQIACRDLG